MRLRLATLVVCTVLLTLAAPAQDWPRTRVYSALQAGRLLDPDRELVHFSLTCTLRIEGSSYPVVDLREVVKGAATARGVNHIVLFDSTLHPVRTIAYNLERPLFCVENHLYLLGDLAVGNLQPEGNVLTFSHHGATVAVSHVDANAYPLPTTRERKGPPQ